MISDQLLRTALTPPSAGVDVNYERLEILGTLGYPPTGLIFTLELGDAILKYMSSVNVFITHPFAAEGVLHSHRGSIISNKALRDSAEGIGLPLFILSKIFSAKHWYPANFSVRKSFNPVPNDSMEPDHEALLPGSAPGDVSAVEFKRHKEQCVHQLGDKVRSIPDILSIAIFLTA
jgi:endoribonuclease Dicer